MTPSMNVYYSDDTVTLHHGDALTVLSSLPDASVNCCVTSPPYFGLRDYGVEGQLGLESSPAEYVENMRALFAQVRRVLADDGCLFLNLGDSYSSGNAGRQAPVETPESQRAPAYGRDDTARSDSRGPDSACCDLCGGRLAVESTHMTRTLRPPHESGEHLTRTVRDSEHQGSQPETVAASPLDAQESTTLESSLPPRADYSRSDSRECAPSIPRSSEPDGQEFAHTTACTCGTAKPLGASDSRTSDTASSGSAYPHSTSAFPPTKNLLGMPWRVAFALQDDDSADIYELRADAPENVRSAVYLETCRIRTSKHEGSTPASTPSGGAKPTPSDTQSAEPHGTRPTTTSSSSTAGSTTSSTASRRSSDRFEGTSADTGGSDSRRYSTTEASSPSVPAAQSGGSTSSHSITSTAVEESTERNSARSTSTSGSTCEGSPTQRASACSVTTATERSATTASARTKKNEPVRIRKADIPAADLDHFHLVKQDRWVLRNDIIWAKPNAMPESVTDRMSTRHEHLFLLTKSPRYWFDLDPIRETLIRPDALTEGQTFNNMTAGRRNTTTYGKASSANLGPTGSRHKNATQVPGRWAAGSGGNHQDSGPDGVGTHTLGRNPGDVWNIPTQPFAAAHFAVMPRTLAERAIQAGCKPAGTVLDPFSGSGTTGLAAARHGRRYVGIDLNAEYLDLSLRTRLRQPGLDFGEGA